MPESNITFLNISKSKHIEEAIQKKIEKLKAIFQPIIKCDITLSHQHNHHSPGFYVAEISIAIPHQTSIICRSSNNRTVQGLYIAIRDSFQTAERILKKRVQCLRHFENKSLADIEPRL